MENDKEEGGSGQKIGIAGRKWLVKKEESQDGVVLWPSDESDPLGKDEIKEEELPPIEGLGDNDNDEISRYDSM